MLWEPGKTAAIRQSAVLATRTRTGRAGGAWCRGGGGSRPACQRCLLCGLPGLANFSSNLARRDPAAKAQEEDRGEVRGRRASDRPPRPFSAPTHGQPASDCLAGHLSRFQHKHRACVSNTTKPVLLTCFLIATDAPPRCLCGSCLCHPPTGSTSRSAGNAAGPLLVGTQEE